jgi:multidrug efflux pump subunit AcrA (membrane-fusion protein)
VGNLNSAEAAYATAAQATIPEEVQKAQLDVDQAEANLEVANLTEQQRKRLLQQGAISGREVDIATAAAVQAKAAYEIAVKHLQSVRKTTQTADLKSAQGLLTSAKGRYQSAEAQVSYAQLRSPIDGVVTDRPLFVGETAAAGSPVLTVMDTSSLLAKLHLAQASAQKLRLGGAAQVQVPGMDNPVSATVTLISPALDPGSTTVEVWLKLDNKNGNLKVGTPVHAVLAGQTVSKALQVPASALLPGQDGSTAVMVVGNDSIAHTRQVKIGIRTPEEIQIVSGLSPADMVIVEGSYGLDDGTKVTLGGEKQEGEDKD